MAGNQAYARFNIIVGTNGTGKSTFVDSILAATHFKNALVYIESIDQGGKPFSGLPVIDLYDYKGGKVCIDADSIDFTSFITMVEKKYRNGILIVDEAGEYEEVITTQKGGVLPPLRTIFKQKRKYNVETYLIYHSASEVPVRLFKWVNNVIMFHQTDKFAHKGGVIPRIDELNAAQKRIEQKYFAGNLYNCERIQLS